jgi:predicted dinucleotide-binding enzyme
VLFYATDGASAAATVERLIRVAGFEPWKAGGLAAAGRIEAPGGDLHQYGFNGDVVDIDRAKAATAGTAA